MTYTTIAAGVVVAVLVLLTLLTVVLIVFRRNQGSASNNPYSKPQTQDHGRVQFVQAQVHGVPVYRPNAVEENAATGIRTPLPVYTRQPGAELDVEIVDQRLAQAAQLEEGRSEHPMQVKGNRESLPPYQP